MDLDQVGGQIKACRKSLKLSVRAAAMRGRMGHSTWADLEAGKYPPSMSTQTSVARALSWPMNWYDMFVADELTSWRDMPTVDPQSSIDAVILEALVPPTNPHSHDPWVRRGDLPATKRELADLTEQLSSLREDLQRQLDELAAEGARQEQRRQEGLHLVLALAELMGVDRTRLPNVD